VGASAEEVESRELLTRFGTYVRGARHGDIWHLPGGASVMVQAVGTKDGARDWRAWRNTIAEIKRALRTAGVVFEEVKKERVPVAATEATKVVTKTVAAMATTKSPMTLPAAIAALGVHVTRKRCVMEEIEATVDLSALAALLGLVRAEDAQVETATVEMYGPDGNEIEGPVVVRVRVTRTEAAA
jgi:enamine deaminase RidA (YjgF/YER057c/UK114 family)